VTRWLPKGWAIRTGGQLRRRDWSYEAHAPGLHVEGGGDLSQREVDRAARRALRGEALRLMADGWSADRVHYIVAGVAFCGRVVDVIASPHRGYEPCQRCVRIKQALQAEQEAVRT
jgi:hypothetical protein